MNKYKLYLLIPLSIGLAPVVLSIFDASFTFDPLGTAIIIELFLIGVFTGIPLAHTFITMPDKRRRLCAIVGYLAAAPFSFFMFLILTDGLQITLTWHELMSLSFVMQLLIAALVASSFMIIGVLLGRRCGRTVQTPASPVPKQEGAPSAEEKSNRWICDRCEKEVKFDDKYCPNCGNDLSEITG